MNTSKAASKAVLPPVHPGEILLEEFLVPLEMSARALAAAIGVTPARVSDIVAGRRGVTADTALRLGRYFGTTPELWLNLQVQFDLETARQDLSSTVASIHPRAPAAREKTTRGTSVPRQGKAGMRTSL